MFGRKMYKFVVVCEDKNRYDVLCKAAYGALLFDKKSDFNVITNGRVHIVEYSIPLGGKAWNRFGQILREHGYELMQVYKIGCLYGLKEI